MKKAQCFNMCLYIQNLHNSHVNTLADLWKHTRSILVIFFIVIREMCAHDNVLLNILELHGVRKGIQCLHT